MKKALVVPSRILLAIALVISFSGCDILIDLFGDGDGDAGENAVVLTNHSVTPALVKNVAPGVEVFSLMSSDDRFPMSPNFIMGGSPDGAGLLKNDDGTFTYVTNHEDNYSVSRITLDETFKPVKGEYIITSDHGRWRLCSATMATPEEHGYGPLFITAGESGPESQIHAANPFAAQNTSRILTSFGAWSTENAVPLPKTAYPGKTVVIIGDDDSREFGGQIALYVGEGVGNLDTGNLYVLARVDDNTRERDMVVGETYEVEFRQIEDQTTLAPSEFNPASAALNAMPFGRVEDLDYRKDGVGREVYFNVTGQNDSGANADFSRTKYGRVYRLTMDVTNPLKATIEVILDGDDRGGIAGQFQNPDNILATENYLYIQEDPNGYGDETHDAYIYQYEIETGRMQVVMELDHRRGEDKYNVDRDGITPSESRLGGWEYGAMLDVSETLGIPNTFVLNIQPHSWRSPVYAGVDGGTLRAAENQASHVVVVKGLER